MEEDDSSDGKDVVLPQGRNKCDGPDNQSNDNTDEIKEDKDKSVCCICQEEVCDDSYAILVNTENVLN